MPTQNTIRRVSRWAWLPCLLLVGVVSGCQNLQLPRIDPFGERIFLPPPNRTQLEIPRPNCLKNLPCLSRRSTAGQPLGLPVGSPMDPSAMVMGPPPLPPSSLPANPWVGSGPVGTAVQPLVQAPVLPHPGAKGPPCEHQGALGSCLELRRKARELGVPAQNPYKILHRGKRGELLLTPSKIVAPVGSEVVVLSGICGPDGYFVTNQPIEFTLSQDSVGQIIDYQGRPSGALRSWMPTKAKKSSGDYLVLNTGRKSETIDRGTPTRIDNIHVEKGQAWLSVSSASPGNSYITAMAPQAEAWDKRLKSMEIQWIDALWTLPTPVTATAGANYPLVTNIRQIQDGLGIGSWKVRYQIAGGAAAQFLPSGSQTAEVVTGPDGNASVEIRQPPGEIGPGTTFIRVDIIRPASNAAGFELLESAVTSIRWVAPALTIRAIGPRVVALSTPFNYRLEITNPGDQVARETQVSLEGLPEGLTFVSSSPKPATFGERLVWDLGDVAPGTQPNVIDLQLKSDTAVGTARLCFDVASQVDQLQTRACAETQVIAPCLGLKIDGDRQGRVGDLTTFKITFVNQCEQDLRGIFARVTAGPGLEIVGRSGPVTFGPMETPLAFGESKSLELTLKIQQSGQHFFHVDVQAEGGHTASISRSITATSVNQPAVTMQLASGEAVAVDQRHRVAARITNTGNLPLTGVRVRTENSNSLQPLASLPQAYDEDGLIVVYLDSLEPGSYRDVTVEYRAITRDPEAFARFQVQTDQGVEDLKEVGIRIVPSEAADAGVGAGGSPRPTDGPGIGVPPRQSESPPGMLAVQLTAATPVVRRQAPFDVELAVTNQRATSDRNVRLLLQTPPGIQFQGVVGSTTGVRSSADGQQHEFTMIQELRAGESVRIVVRLLPVQTGTPRLEISAISESAAVPSSDVLDLTVTP